MEVKKDILTHSESWPTLKSPQHDPQLVCPTESCAEKRGAEHHDRTASTRQVFNNPASQERRVKAIFAKLSEKELTPRKLEGIAEVTRLAKDFCGLLDQKSLEEQAFITSAIWTRTLRPMMVSADLVRIVSAIINGRMATITKNALPHGQWIPFAKRAYSGINIRVLQENMRLAGMRNVEKHFDLGLTTLNKIVVIAEKPPFIGSDDPIESVLDYIRDSSGVSLDDEAILPSLAIIDHKLKASGVKISINRLAAYLSCGYDIVSDDIKEMVLLNKNGDDPAEHLETTMKNAGNRVFRLLPKAASNKGKNPAAISSAIPDINALFAQMSDALTLAIKNTVSIGENVDRNLYEKVSVDLKTFGETVFATA